MKLITDIDGVLLDMLAPVRAAYPIEDSAVKQWGIQECLGVDDREHGRIWDLIWNTPLSPYPETMGFLETLKEHGEVYGLSQRQPGEAHIAALRDFYRLGIPVWIVDTFEGKLDFLRKQTWDFYLEDCLLNAIRAGAEFGQDKVLLLDRPWNQSCNLGRCFMRVDGYQDVIERVREARQ